MCQNLNSFFFEIESISKEINRAEQECYEHFPLTYRAGDANGLYAGFLVEEQQNKVFKKIIFSTSYIITVQYIWKICSSFV